MNRSTLENSYIVWSTYPDFAYGLMIIAGTRIPSP
jgi:hypothetical protein